MQLPHGMKSRPPFSRLCTGLLVLGCSLSGLSCSSSNQGEHPLSSRAWWRGDGIEGKPKIFINLSTQRLLYFRDKKLVGISPISSGRESTGTVTGTYRILDKDIDHRSSIFGAFVDKAGNVVQGDVDSRTDHAPPGTTYQGANMRYFMRIVGGIGMHEGYLPGYPASHGCIRLPTKMAAIFFKETPPGTPVVIEGQSSLAATESAIPIGADKVMDVATGDSKRAAKMAKAAAAAESKTQDKPKTTVRRAVVNVSKPSGFGSMFNWSRRPPRGSTIYLDQ